MPRICPASAAGICCAVSEAMPVRPFTVNCLSWTPNVLSTLLTELPTSIARWLA